MPIFVPKDLWRWLIGPHTSPQQELRYDYPELNSSYQVPDSSPFFASIHQPLGVEPLGQRGQP